MNIVEKFFSLFGFFFTWTQPVSQPNRLPPFLSITLRKKSAFMGVEQEPVFHYLFVEVEKLVIVLLWAFAFVVMAVVNARNEYLLHELVTMGFAVIAILPINYNLAGYFSYWRKRY